VDQPPLVGYRHHGDWFHDQYVLQVKEQAVRSIIFVT